jgi:hypothetical protein
MCLREHTREREREREEEEEERGRENDKRSASVTIVPTTRSKISSDNFFFNDRHAVKQPTAKAKKTFLFGH